MRRNNTCFSDCIFFKDLINVFIFKERGREGEREGEKHQSFPSHIPPTGDPAHTPPTVPACNPGMCPVWQLNPQPFSSQARAQSTEPHLPGLTVISYCLGCLTMSILFIYIYFGNLCIHTHTHIHSIHWSYISVPNLFMYLPIEYILYT